MTWKTYSAGVLVSSALLVSGVLWYSEPQTPFVSGESAAECLAAWYERGVAGLVDSRDTPAAYAAETNFVSVHIERAPIYAAMDGLRRSAQTAALYEDLNNVRFYSGPFWLVETNRPTFDAAAADAIAEVEYTYGYHTNRTYRTPEGELVHFKTYTNSLASQVTLHYLTLGTIIGPGANGHAYPEPFQHWDPYPGQSNGAIEKVCLPQQFVFPVLGDFNCGENSTPGVPASTFAWGADENWWISAGLSESNAWQYDSMERVTNGNVRLSSLVSASHLSDIRTVAGAMRTTAAFCTEFMDDEATSIEKVHVEWELPYPPATPYASFSDVCGRLRAGSVITQSIANSGSTLPLDLVSTHLSVPVLAIDIADTSYGTVTTYSPPDSDSYSYDDSTNYVALSGGAGGFGEYTRIRQARVGYPSLYALTNGFVKRVRIYTLATYPIPENIPPSSAFTTNWSSHEDWVLGEGATGDLGYRDDEAAYSREVTSADTTGPGAFSDLSYGLAILLSTRTVPPGFTPGRDSAVGIPITRARAKLLQTWDNPTGKLYFDLGLVADPFSPTPMQYDEYVELETATMDSFVDEYYNNTKVRTDTDSSNYQKTTRHQTGKTAHTIRLRGFVVVVDWNWKHLSPDGPFSPTPNVPAWMSP